MTLLLIIKTATTVRHIELIICWLLKRGLHFKYLKQVTEM